MKVILTGATGLIGREVGKRLVANGHELIVLVRDQKRARSELPFPAEIVQWASLDKLKSNESLTNSFRSASAVVHLAGEPIAAGRWTEARKLKIRNSRVDTTRDLVQLTKTLPEVRTFIMGTAAGFYGARGNEELTEDSDKGAGFLSDVVSDWESEGAKVEGCRLVQIRTTMVLSPHGGALSKMVPLFQNGMGGVIGNGKQWMSWIHIDDIARLFVEALENPAYQGAINGAAPQPSTNKVFTQQLSRALAVPALFRVPSFILKVGLGEMSSVLLESQRVLPARAEALGFRFLHPNLEEALHDVTGFRAREEELLEEQWVPRAPHEIFPYFCNEVNLEELTPDFLKFRVIGKSTPEIQKGTLIDYRISLHGVKLKWRTIIEEWNPGHAFVDSQLSGPFRKWHHTHEFIPLGGGTLLRDRVRYRLPLGIVGKTSGGWMVSRDVKKIFDFRKQKIEERFGAR